MNKINPHKHASRLLSVFLTKDRALRYINDSISLGVELEFWKEVKIELEKL